MSVNIRRRISIIESLLNRKCASCLDKIHLRRCSICENFSVDCEDCLIDHIEGIMAELDNIIYELYKKHIKKNNLQEDIEDIEVKDLMVKYENIKDKLYYNIVTCKECIDKY